MQANYRVIGFYDGGSTEMETFETETQARQWLEGYTRQGDWGGYESFICYEIASDDELWCIENEDS